MPKKNVCRKKKIDEKNFLEKNFSKNLFAQKNFTEKIYNLQKRKIYKNYISPIKVAFWQEKISQQKILTKED